MIVELTAFLIFTVTSVGQITAVEAKVFKGYGECVAYRDRSFADMVEYNRSPDRTSMRGLSPCVNVMDTEIPRCVPQIQKDRPNKRKIPKYGPMPFRSGVIG